MPMRRCPNCRDTRSGQYCYKCGAKLEEVPLPRCRCGHELLPFENYCDECGCSREEALKHNTGLQSKGRTARFLEFVSQYFNS